MAKKDCQKSRKDQNQKEEITGLKCLFHYRNFTKEGLWHSVSDEDKYAGIAKALVMRVDSSIHANHVTELAKWFELCKCKEKLNKWKWNATNAKDQEKLQKVSAQFAEVKKFN